MPNSDNDVIPPRFGAIVAVSGAVLLVIATMFHPMSADPNDTVAAFTEYAGDKHWIASHLGQFVGIVLLFAGLAALGDTLRGDVDAWLARLGVYFGLAALAGSAVLQAVDGVALKTMVDGWAKAGAEQKLSAFLAGVAVRQIEIGAAAYSRMLFGVAVTAIGGAIISSIRYPKWLGWLGIAGGLGIFVAGIATAFTGFSATTMAIGMPADLVAIVWLSLTGVFMWKQSD